MLRNWTEIDRLQLVRSVYPIEVKPADSNETDSQDQEEYVTNGELRKREEVEELNKKVKRNRIVWKKCGLKRNGFVEKGLEQNGVADNSYEIEKSCNEKGKGTGIEEKYFIVNQIDFSHLDKMQRQKAGKLLLKEVDSFSRDDDDIGCAKDRVLNLGPKDDVPVQRNYVSFSKPLYPEVKRYIQDLLNRGFNKPSQSPYSSSVLCVRKPDNSLRLCVNYRLLNAKTVADKHPIPKVQETLENLGGNRRFSSLHQGKAYHQGFMSEKSQTLTAFITPWGLYEFVRIPFGLSQPPGAFQCFMERVIGSDLRDVIAVSYLDDVIRFSKTFDEDLEHLRIIFKHLRESDITLKPKKCKMFRKQVQFPGRVVSEQGHTLDTKRQLPVFEVKHLRQLVTLEVYWLSELLPAMDLSVFNNCKTIV